LGAGGRRFKSGRPDFFWIDSRWSIVDGKSKNLFTGIKGIKANIQYPISNIQFSIFNDTCRGVVSPPDVFIHWIVGKLWIFKFKKEADKCRD